MKVLLNQRVDSRQISTSHRRTCINVYLFLLWLSVSVCKRFMAYASRTLSISAFRLALIGVLTVFHWISFHSCLPFRWAKERASSTNPITVAAKMLKVFFSFDSKLFTQPMLLKLLQILTHYFDFHPVATGTHSVSKCCF